MDAIGDTDNQPIQAPKPKRVLTEQQKQNLAKGRELGRQRLKEKSDKVKEERSKANEELLKLELSNTALKDKAVIKKANSLIKEKLNIKKTFDVANESESEDEIIIPIQPKKPKKKKVIYLPPESDSEEEVIYKAPPKQKSEKKIETNVAPKSLPNQIIFY